MTTHHYTGERAPTRPEHYDPDQDKWFYDDTGEEDSAAQRGDRRNFIGGPGVTPRSRTTQAEENAPSAGAFAPQALYDPAYRAQQQTALDALQRESAMGGWTPEEKAAYQRQAAQSAGVAIGQRMGQAQQMISKGLPPSVANQLAGEIGQQQQAQAGYLMGTQAQQAANQRAQAAADQALGLSNQMAQESAAESEFNAGQRTRGVLKEMATRLGQQYDEQQRSDQQQAQTVQGITQAAEGGLGAFDAYLNRNRNRGGAAKTGGGWGS